MKPGNCAILSFKDCISKYSPITRKYLTEIRLKYRGKSGSSGQKIEPQFPNTCPGNLRNLLSLYLWEWEQLHRLLVGQLLKPK